MSKSQKRWMFGVLAVVAISILYLSLLKSQTLQTTGGLSVFDMVPVAGQSAQVYVQAR